MLKLTTDRHEASRASATAELLVSLWRYSDGDPLTGASNASGVGRNHDTWPKYGPIVCCERF